MADDHGTVWYHFDYTVGLKDGTTHTTKIEIQVTEWWIDGAPYNNTTEQKTYAWETAKWYIGKIVGNTNLLIMNLWMVTMIRKRMDAELGCDAQDAALNGDDNGRTRR